MNNTPTLPPHAVLTELGIWGHHRAHFLKVAVNLKLADHIGDDSLSAEVLSERIGANPKSFKRFLRTLCSIGILHLNQEEEFSLTELGQALKKGAPGAAYSAIYMLFIEAGIKAWTHLEDAVMTGEPSFESANGETFFEYLGRHPDQIAMFSETMVNLSNAEPPTVAVAYDFARFKNIVDVGGATGHLIATILEQHEGPHAILSDLPQVLADAPALLQERGVQDRITLTPANFFDSVPAGGDAYILSHVIHDWREEQAIAILQNCRKAMSDTATLLLVEVVLGDAHTDTHGAMLDMSMLIYAGGEERTAEGYRELLLKGGFELTQIVPTTSNASIIEAKPC